MIMKPVQSCDVFFHHHQDKLEAWPSSRTQFAMLAWKITIQQQQCTWGYTRGGVWPLKSQNITNPRRTFWYQIRLCVEGGGDEEEFPPKQHSLREITARLWLRREEHGECVSCAPDISAVISSQLYFPGSVGGGLVEFARWQLHRPEPPVETIFKVRAEHLFSLERECKLRHYQWCCSCRRGVRMLKRWLRVSPPSEPSWALMQAANMWIWTSHHVLQKMHAPWTCQQKCPIMSYIIGHGCHVAGAETQLKPSNMNIYADMDSVYADKPRQPRVSIARSFNCWSLARVCHAWQASLSCFDRAEKSWAAALHLLLRL